MREQHFTLEADLIPGFGLVQSFLLLTDHYILGRAAFIFTILVNVGGLMAFRFTRLSVSRGEPPPAPAPSRSPWESEDWDVPFLQRGAV